MATSSHFGLLLILGLFIGAAAGLVGALMLFRRIALVGDAFGHLALPGVSLALMYHFDVGLGALLFLTGGILLIWLLEQYTHLDFDVLTGVLFASALAFSFLLLSKEEYDIALLGTMGGISPYFIVAGCIGSVLIAAITYHYFSHFALARLSGDLARSSGINLKKENLIFLLTIGLTVAIGIRIVGALMTAALLTIPAATSANMNRSFYTYALSSMLLAGIAVPLGMACSAYFALPLGPCVVLISSLLFACSLIFKQ